MKKQIKILASVITLLLIISSICTVFANEVEPPADDPIILPLYNTYVCTRTFSISNSGLADVCVDYVGIPNTFTQTKVTAKIQKHVFLFIWSDVAVNANNQWVVYSTNTADTINLTHQLDSTGTYRAIITVEICGTTNEVDTFNDTIEYQYS